MRSVDAHALLTAADTGLPALPLLLDAVALAERFAAPVSRSYLRYKPGTSAIALVDVDGRPAIASAWSPGNGDKRAKALKHVDPDDVLLDAPEEGLLIVDALTDRKLPALRHLVRSGHVGPWLTRRGYPIAASTIPVTLAHKPARRWVGRMPTEQSGQQIVLRSYAGRGHDVAMAAHGLIDPAACASVRLPRVVGNHRRGLIALEHLPGHTLDTRVPAAALRRLGACLGELHASGQFIAGTGVESRVDHQGVDRSVVAPHAHPATPGGLDVLAPVLDETLALARQVDTAARAALRPGPVSVIHGDFSLDQVVADGHSLGIIDLDRVRVGNPLDDIASLLAAAALTALSSGGAIGAAALIDRLRTPFVAGHSSTWRADLSDDLGPRTALALLARSGEPFRAGRDDWPQATRELVSLAGSLVTGRAAA